MIMIGTFVSFSLKIIGGLLISSLLVVPVLTAQQIAKSFRYSLLLSVLFGLLGVAVGITSSFYFDIPASSGVVLMLIFLFLLVFLVLQIYKKE